MSHTPYDANVNIRTNSKMLRIYKILNRNKLQEALNRHIRNVIFQSGNDERISDLDIAALRQDLIEDEIETQKRTIETREELRILDEWYRDRKNRITQESVVGEDKNEEYPIDLEPDPTLDE